MLFNFFYLMAKKSRQYSLKVYPNYDMIGLKEDEFSTRTMKQSRLVEIGLRQKDFNILAAGHRPLSLPIPGQPQGEYEVGLTDTTKHTIKKRPGDIPLYIIPVRILSSMK
jgi:hypothetical protein